MSGYHAEVCPCGGFQIQRHNDTRDWISRILQKEYGIPTKIEPRVFNVPGDSHCDIEASGAGPGDRDVMIDVSFTQPLQYTNKEPLYAAKERETEKDAKYLSLCHDEGLFFVPFVIETYGGIGPRATLWLKKLFNKLPPSTRTFPNFTIKDERDYFYQRLAILHQTATARYQRKKLAGFLH